MRYFWSWSCALLMLAALVTLACGSGSANGRQLQSISIAETVTGQQVQLVATGTFSAPPTTVTPLPVMWFSDLPPGQYTLTTQPYVVQCGYPPTIYAIAPANPNAPSSGSITSATMIKAGMDAVCPSQRRDRRASCIAGTSLCSFIPGTRLKFLALHH